MPLGALSITYAAIDGMYSLATAIELSSVDDGMTDKFGNCGNCGNCSLRDSCNGNCQFAPESMRLSEKCRYCGSGERER